MFPSRLRRVFLAGVLATGLPMPAAAGQSAGLGQLREMALNEPLQIENGWARAFVQHGRPILSGDLAKFDPYCSLEVKTVARPGMNLIVEPATFTVTRVQHKHIPGGVFGGLLNLEDDPGPVEPEVDIYLESPSQPGVIRARCVKWEADAAFARRVGIDEVREAFGQIATFR